MLRFAAVIVCGGLMAGCAGTQQVVPTGDVVAVEPLPPSYRQVIIAKVKETFFDPYSIRDAGISQPIRGQSALGATATVCVRANAKNRMGGYTGIKASSYTFRAGNLVLVDTDYAAMTCNAAVYEPFPEIDAGAPAPAKHPPRAR
jgi:hypothetical protein